MFAIASYFRAEGIHIVIESASPPRAALGGSSAAAVALTAALSKAREKMGETFPSRKSIALLAHEIEASVAVVPCGLQDQLAAVYGGVNAWYWKGGAKGRIFRKKAVVPKSAHRSLEKHLLLAYCGIPHESKDINGKWVAQFLSGKNRKRWTEIVGCAKAFADALSKRNLHAAATLMNRETAIRRQMTPDVLEDMGKKLVKSAVANNCGARFTGAGGGGCIWALGEIESISRLARSWQEILSSQKEACLLNVKIDSQGVL
jgi:D-glycero-alpha-D-manno-heptose-7-phosphate kinase